MRPRKNQPTKATANALVPVNGGSSTEIALPDALIASAKGFAKHSRSESTRRNYSRWWGDFSDWCVQHGREALPATVETLVGYITYLAQGRGGTRPPLAIASISQAVAAIKLRQRTKGYPFDADHPLLKEVMKGIRRETAKVRSIRRVKPFMFSDLRELLEMMRPTVLREARDAALIALACAGALRRSELVGLDWAVLGTSEDKRRTGYLMIDDGGMTIRLMTSKASQDVAQDVAVPRDFTPLICQAVEHWIAFAKIERGTPLFRSTQGGSTMLPQSGYVGVTWHQRTQDCKPWRARFGGQSLGSFATEAAAHAACCKAKGVPTGRPEERVKLSYTRLGAPEVATIIKKRMKQLIEARNNKRGAKKLSREEMDAQVAMYSGHSARVGYVTSAADRDIPSHRIQQQTRHKTADMVAVYIRDIDIRKNSGLKGVGF